MGFCCSSRPERGSILQPEQAEVNAMLVLTTKPALRELADLLCRSHTCLVLSSCSSRGLDVGLWPPLQLLSYESFTDPVTNLELLWFVCLCPLHPLPLLFFPRPPLLSFLSCTRHSPGPMRSPRRGLGDCVAPQALHSLGESLSNLWSKVDVLVTLPSPVILSRSHP